MNASRKEETDGRWRQAKAKNSERSVAQENQPRVGVCPPAWPCLAFESGEWAAATKHSDCRLSEPGGTVQRFNSCFTEAIRGDRILN